MALPSTLYRFRIELSDMDRGVYQSLSLRVARHPSEGESYLLTRMLAYALSFDERLELSPGLCADDEPALFVRDAQNRNFAHWIEIGNPSARRLNKAAKSAPFVQVYTYKDADNLRREIRGERVHRIEAIELYALEHAFLSQLEKTLARDNEWALMRQDAALTLAVDGETFMSALPLQRLP
jgi:uncharacterized protein YaeQ